MYSQRRNKFYSINNLRLDHSIDNKKMEDIHQHLLFFSFFLNKCELDSIQFVIKSFKFLL
jgi:hypothetical protein